MGALITPTVSRQKRQYNTSGEIQDKDKIWQIPPNLIMPNLKQPRRHFDEEDILELANSIKTHGILQPLLAVEKSDGGYELVSGERRLRASKLANLATVPVIIKKMADQEKLEVALVENIQRQDLNPIEEAFAYKRLIEEFGLTQEQVAEKVGKSRPAVANFIRLLDLPEQIKQALSERKINTGQARSLLGLKDEKQQLDMLASMLGTKITVRELEKTIALQSIGGKGARKDPNVAYLEEKLRLALGTKISISQKGEQGNISVYFYSKEELKRLIKRISGEEN